MNKIDDLKAKHDKLARDLEAIIKKGKVAALDRVADLMTKFDGRIKQLRAALDAQEKSRAMKKGGPAADTGAPPAPNPAPATTAAKAPAKKVAKKTAKKAARTLAPKAAPPAAKSAAKNVKSPAKTAKKAVKKAVKSAPVKKAARAK